MTTPYTYLIKHIPSGKVYYGLRYGKNCHPSDFWKTYFTSSKDVKALIKKDGINSFEFEIRKVFDCPKKAIQWEIKVLRRIKAVKRDDFINRNIPGSTIFKHSEEAKQKMRRKKGPISKEHAAALSAALKGKKKPKWSEERRKAFSEYRKGKNYGHVGEAHWNFGKKRSEETNKAIVEKQRLKRWMTNGTESVFIGPEEVEIFLERGFTFGRTFDKMLK